MLANPLALPQFMPSAFTPVDMNSAALPPLPVNPTPLSREAINALCGDDLNAYAWQAACLWPDSTTVQAQRQGLDFVELTRVFLWDKVSRALRHQRSGGEFEPVNFCAEPRPLSDQLKRPLYPPPPPPPPCYITPIPPPPPPKPGAVSWCMSPALALASIRPWSICSDRPILLYPGRPCAARTI
jgi:hypothetical protein